MNGGLGPVRWNKGKGKGNDNDKGRMICSVLKSSPEVSLCCPELCPDCGQQRASGCVDSTDRAVR